MGEYDASMLCDYLPLYYKRLFPYGPYWKWLNYGGVQNNYFANREFSFTLADDVYIRYQSFKDQQEMEKEIQKWQPHKIDIGAVYNYMPKMRKLVKSSAFEAIEKELVFDIDLTDYDGVRGCCSGSNMCLNCWPLMIIAVKVINRALREDFGFENILWVYSGRRGIHCWVCDQTARKLSPSARSAIAEYITLIRGGENRTKKVTLTEVLHPFVQKSLDIIREHFISYAVKAQDFLADAAKWDRVLSLVPDDDLRSGLSLAFDKDAHSTNERWRLIEATLSAAQSNDKYRSCRHTIDEILLQFCYPRLDVNVSKGLNHLLKSPFCVHPKTGKVCVPVDPSNVDDFNPDTVPTISCLCEELNTISKSEDEGDEKRLKDYRKTSLSTYLRVFDSFLHGLETKRRLQRESNIKTDNSDF